MPLMTVLATWLAFAVAWISAPAYIDMHAGLGLSCPSLAALWLALAQSGAVYIVPGAITGAIGWLIATRSRHVGRFANASLMIALFHTIATHAAAVLPAYSLCRPV